MSFKKSQKYLTELVEKYYTQIMSTAPVSRIFITHADAEIASDMDNWLYLFDESIIQILYYNVDGDISEIRDFVLSNNAKDFSMPGSFSTLNFSDMYEITPAEVEKLFDLVIDDFIDVIKDKRPSIEVLGFIYHKNKFVIDKLIDNNYFEYFDSSELIKLYSVVNDDRLLPTYARDVFLF